MMCAAAILLTLVLFCALLYIALPEIYSRGHLRATRKLKTALPRLAAWPRRYRQFAVATLDDLLNPALQSLCTLPAALPHWQAGFLSRWDAWVQSLEDAVAALRAKGLRDCVAGLYANPALAVAERPGLARLSRQDQLRVCLFILLVGLCRAYTIFPLSDYYISGPAARLPVSFAVARTDVAVLGATTTLPFIFIRSNFPTLNGAPLHRAEISTAPLSTYDPLYLARHGEAREKPSGPLQFDHGVVRLATVDGPVLIADSMLPAAESDVLVLPPAPAGLPQADARQEAALAARQCPRSEGEDGMEIFLRGLSLPVPGGFARASGQKYWQYAKTYARQYGITPSLMMAIMHTESGFNPFAVSSRQAVGLMQIVPETAGNEAYRFLKGKGVAPTMQALFNPENNIKYGAVYLHLLDRYHFGAVANRASRQMCVIAAYNGGPNAVLQVFHPVRAEALSRINAISPAELYAKLVSDMPHPETRRYVEKVVGRMQSYSAH
jgi:soluble lytic murein transglycosylase-like protein